jgi:hypothetical protein
MAIAQRMKLHAHRAWLWAGTSKGRLGDETMLDDRQFDPHPSCRNYRIRIGIGISREDFGGAGEGGVACDLGGF